MSQVNSQAAQSGVLIKLIVFSLSLGIVPLSAYYGTLNYLWEGNTIYAAITAIVSANLILVAYIITAAAEESSAKPSDSKGTESETKKDK
ncbi:hypothetical protein CC2G_010655 [Coprinopsis cinerea AmutBmut pab1-1]|nr:hypothetical protein CC2G_010655 [Coprinopsis cinerea AmutBmut pab1-1]